VASYAEKSLVLFAFLLVGLTVGYLTFLIFRISVHQQKFDWSGALSVVTSLAGGGFLSYQSQPLNFAAYGIGFSIGFAIYWGLKQRRPSQEGRPQEPLWETGSRAAPTNHDTLGSRTAPTSRARPSALSLGSQAVPDWKDEGDLDSVPGFGQRVRIPEAPNDLIRAVIDDVNFPTAQRVRALLALRTRRHSEDILLTESLRADLGLDDFELFILAALLRVPFPPQSESLELYVVEDLVNLVEGR